MSRYPSWGLYPSANQTIRRIHWRDEQLPLPADPDLPVLPRGLGRSYGDSCLNDEGWLIDATALDRIIEFDEAAGRIRAEGGVSLAALIEIVLPRGFFIPVSPGTKYVTLAGAVANDVHGKNHHVAGTFGRFVERFELARSDGSRMICSAEENAELYRATIGGLGLTGLITWVDLRLRRVAGPLIDVETIRFERFDDFFALAQESDRRFEYTVAWVDCLARGRQLGRGVFIRGNHAEFGAPPPPGKATRQPRITVPFHAPGILLNRVSLRAFNTAYFHKHRRGIDRRRTHYDPFFYPLDGVGDWNRLYGRRGFLQYQCVVPRDAGRGPLRQILERVAEDGSGSALTVLKEFGEAASPGLLSFPRPGLTIALDFAIRGRETFVLLDELDSLVRGCGGRVYPAKDARMSAESFRAFYPAWSEFARHVDPRFSSSFWRRVTADGAS